MSSAAASHGRRAPRRARDGFRHALQVLNRQRLSGALDHPAFLRQLLELHFRFGRAGFTVEDLTRELDEHKRRQAQGALWQERLARREPEVRCRLPE